MLIILIFINNMSIIKVYYFQILTSHFKHIFNKYYITIVSNLQSFFKLSIIAMSLSSIKVHFQKLKPDIIPSFHFIILNVFCM